MASEAERLTAVLQAWLETQELPRPPFSVRAIEEPATLTLGPLTVRFRIDRIDSLRWDDALAAGDGSAPLSAERETGRGEHLAIIDYKEWPYRRCGNTGCCHGPCRRKRASMHLRCMPQRRIGIEAVALAQVKSGESRSRGLANAGAAWEGLKDAALVSQGRFTTLSEVITYWGECFGALTTDFQKGIAGVAPARLPAPLQAL